MISDDDWARKAREVLGKDWARKVPWGRSYRPKPKTDQQLAKQLAGRIGRRMGGRLGRYLILAGIPVIGAIGTAIWEAITPGELGSGEITPEQRAAQRERKRLAPGEGVLLPPDRRPAPAPRPARPVSPAVQRATERARQIPGSTAAERVEHARRTFPTEPIPQLERRTEVFKGPAPAPIPPAGTHPPTRLIRFPRIYRAEQAIKRGIGRLKSNPAQTRRIISGAQDLLTKQRSGARDVIVQPVPQAVVQPITNIVTQPTGPSIVQTPYGMPQYIPIPMSRFDTGSSRTSCQCPPKKRKGPARECREWGQLSWRSGRKKGKAAGRRCVVYKT